MNLEKSFSDLLHERAQSRKDRAVLIVCFNKIVLGKNHSSLGEVAAAFEAAHLAKPRPATVADILKKDKRVQLASGRLRSLRPGDDFFRKKFPEFEQPDPAVALGTDAASALSATPFIDRDYMSSLAMMMELYANLHVLENSMRRFIEGELEKQLGEDWWEKASNKPMQRKHDDRLTKEREKKWLPARSEVGPLYSLDWPDLISLMRRYESVFAPKLGDIGFLHRFEDLGLLRNVVAHHGFVADADEFSRVRLALRDWTKQVSTE